MEVIVRPSEISGTIQGPASKSSMQRACAAALLAKGETMIKNPGKSNDDLASLAVIGGLGAHLEWQPDGSLRVNSQGVNPVSAELDCGESGLGIRMFTPIIALSEKRITVTGRGSLASRPMDFFDEILPALGVTVQSNHGRLPIQVQGPIKPANLEIDGSLSSQFLTGLLMSFGASEARDVSIRVLNLRSRPYIDLTLKVMGLFGLKLPENRNYEEFYFDSSVNQSANASRIYEVESDWSGAAFLLVAGAIAGEVRVNGLDSESVQADKAILSALTDCGAAVVTGTHSISVTSMRKSGKSLQAFQFDATDCPDLFPPLVALATFCEGVSRIKGTNRLTHKESNRAITLQQEFLKLGVLIELEEDWMMVRGGKGIKGAHVHSRHDHRIAMACAVAALAADGETRIGEAQAIDKSYPTFFDDLAKLGAQIEKTSARISIQ